MTVGDRFRKWISDTAAGFADRLTIWTTGVVSKGAHKALEDREPEIKDLMRETLTKIKDNPLCPPELRKTLEEALEKADVGVTITGWIIYVIGSILALLSMGTVPARRMEQAADYAIRSFELDPGSVITAWRRGGKTNDELFEDLRFQGWREDQIETLKFITEYIPGVQDVIRFGVREVYTPEIRTKFGLDEDFPDAIMPDAERIGLAKEVLLKYWGAHWELPSPMQGFEMLRRGLIDEDTLMLLLKTLDVMPFWREKLMNISWEIPTRVDVRRFWEMRTIDEERLREIYTAQGYHGKDLEDYVLWTKIYVAFPDLLARYKNGWITLDDVRREVIAIGMSPTRADEMIEERIKKAAPERTVTEKNLTKADIIKGVKTNVITRAEGVELLMDIGYDNDEAVYILAINIPPDEEDLVVRERQLTKADILSGLKAAVITRSEAGDKLLELRYSPLDVDFLLKLYDAQVKPPVEPKQKEAAKADILLGVKKGLITPEEGYSMLLDLDFSPDAAGFILMVHAEESPFSPVNYPEFKELTQKWKRSVGMEVKPMPEELKKAAGEVVRLTKDVEALKEAVKLEEDKLMPGEVLPAEATARLKELQVKLHRAESELARVKSNYDRLVAEWRH